MENNKVSIYDIAKYLGLSPATVSYVINGVDKVSEVTKQKVLKAIDELGYVPNYTARTLSTGKSHLIGILLPLDDASIAFLQNPFYVEFIGGFEKGMLGYNYDLVIGVTKTQDDLKEWVLRRDLDGLVIIGTCPKNIYSELKRLNIPIVLIDDYSDDANAFNNISSNDEQGMYLATRYLINSGHKNIGFIGKPESYLIDMRRFEGYKKAMEEDHLEIKDDNIYRINATFNDGYEIGEELINKKELTAIVCSADILAIGIMKKIKELGYDVPKDLSIMGYDDISYANFVYPGLSTIRQDISEKGSRAAEILIDKLENDRRGKVTINMEPVLVIRESVKVK